MAFLNGLGGFTGSLANLSAYKPHGSDKIILRTKGGANRLRIKNHPHFARVRENNAEFGGCSKMAGYLRRELLPFANLTDYNLNTAFCSLCKTIQLQDGEGVRGKRSILFSHHRYLLANFPLNQRYGFDTVFRYPLQAVFDRGQGKTRLVIPALQPGIHLQLPWKLPFYRLIVKLFVICDLRHDGKTYGYDEQKNLPNCPVYLSNWLPVTSAWPEEEELLFELQAGINSGATATGNFQLEPWHNLVLAAGIQMGKPRPGETIMEMKYCGTGKILAAG